MNSTTRTTDLIAISPHWLELAAQYKLANETLLLLERGQFEQLEELELTIHGFPSQRERLSTAIPLTILLTLILLTGCIGNLCTAIVIARPKNKYMHTATNYYLFSLAMSDFMLLILGLPLEIFDLWQKWPYIFSESFCIIRGYASELSTYASILTISAFTIERYVAICHPLWAHTMSQLPRAITTIVIIWCLAATCAIAPAAELGIQYKQGPLTNRTLEASAQCLRKTPIYEYMFAISGIVFFLIPMVIVSVLYILIAIELRRSRKMNGAYVKRKLPKQQQQQNSQISHNQNSQYHRNHHNHCHNTCSINTQPVFHGKHSKSRWFWMGESASQRHHLATALEATTLDADSNERVEPNDNKHQKASACPLMAQIMSARPSSAIGNERQPSPATNLLICNPLASSSQEQGKSSVWSPLNWSRQMLFSSGNKQTLRQMSANLNSTNECELNEQDGALFKSSCCVCACDPNNNNNNNNQKNTNNHHKAPRRQQSDQLLCVTSATKDNSTTTNFNQHAGSSNPHLSYHESLISHKNQHHQDHFCDNNAHNCQFISQTHHQNQLQLQHQQHQSRRSASASSKKSVIRMLVGGGEIHPSDTKMATIEPSSRENDKQPDWRRWSARWRARLPQAAMEPPAGSMAVVVSFFICWLPFHAQRILAQYLAAHWGEDNGLLVDLHFKTFYISGVLYYLSPTINPILYQLMSAKFRLAFRETFNCSLFDCLSKSQSTQLQQDQAEGSRRASRQTIIGNTSCNGNNNRSQQQHHFHYHHNNRHSNVIGSHQQQHQQAAATLLNPVSGIEATQAKGSDYQVSLRNQGVTPTFCSSDACRRCSCCSSSQQRRSSSQPASCRCSITTTQTGANFLLASKCWWAGRNPFKKKLTLIFNHFKARQTNNNNHSQAVTVEPPTCERDNNQQDEDRMADEEHLRRMLIDSDRAGAPDPPTSDAAGQNKYQQVNSNKTPDQTTGSESKIISNRGAIEGERFNKLIRAYKESPNNDEHLHSDASISPVMRDASATCAEERDLLIIMQPNGEMKPDQIKTMIIRHDHPKANETPTPGRRCSLQYNVTGYSPVNQLESGQLEAKATINQLTSSICDINKQQQAQKFNRKQSIASSHNTTNDFSTRSDQQTASMENMNRVQQLDEIDCNNKRLQLACMGHSQTSSSATSALDDDGATYSASFTTTISQLTGASLTTTNSNKHLNESLVGSLTQSGDCCPLGTSDTSCIGLLISTASSQPMEQIGNKTVGIGDEDLNGELQVPLLDLQIQQQQQQVASS